MMTARARSGTAEGMDWLELYRRFRFASLATQYHKLPTLFRQRILFRLHNFPSSVGPGGGQRLVGHPIDDHAGALFHVVNAERRPAAELGLVGHQVVEP